MNVSITTNTGCGSQADFGGHEYATWTCPNCGQEICWGCSVRCTDNGSGDGVIQCPYCRYGGYYENGVPIMEQRRKEMDGSRYQPVIAIPNGARALCLKKAQMEKVLAGGSFARLTNRPLTELVGEIFLLFSGAKAYYHGGGWWQFIGYHHSGKDVADVMSALGR